VRSQRLVSTLVEVDPGFNELVEKLFGGMYSPDDVWLALYGPSATETIAVMEKSMPTGTDLSVPGPVASRSTLRSSAGLPRAQKGTLRPARRMSATTVTTAGAPSPKPRRSATSSVLASPSSLVKSDADVDVEWAGEFTKFDEDKRLAFGWSSVVKVDGAPVVDRQGDVVDWEDLEEAAYDYMLRSRKAGGMHRRTADDQVHHIGDVVESFVVTPEKIEKMGLPETMPLGWWIGMKVSDDESWEKVKKREWSGFSVHGRGKRKALS